MTVFALTETVPSTTHPANTLDMFPVANQSLANGDLSTSTKVALPGTVGGGSGAGTFRWIGFGVNNGTTTDQGEPNNTTVTGFGEISCSAVTGPTMPMSAIASGTWTFRLSIAALTYTGTFTFGFRAWQVSADRTVKTLIALAGADASGWVFSGTVTPSATAAVITTITMAATGAVTFGATTPYLYIEAILKVVSVGAATASLAFSNANNTVQVPAITYAMTGSETTSVSDVAAPQTSRSRTAPETTTLSDAAAQSATRSRTGAETALAPPNPSYIGTCGTFQTNTPVTTSGQTMVMTLSAPVASGTQIVVAMNANNISSGGNVPFSVTDSAGNTYTAVQESNSTTGATVPQKFFACTASRAMSTSDTITFTLTVSYNPNVFNAVAFNVSGVTPTSLADVSSGGGFVTGISGSPSIATISGLATGDVIVGAVSVGSGTTTDTFTQDTDTLNGTWRTPTRVGSASNGANGESVLNVGVKVVTATGTQTYNPTLGTGRSWEASILRLPSAGGTGTFGDSAVPATTRTRSGTETVVTSDVAAPTTTRARTAPESTALSDAVATNAQHARTGNESTVLTDAASRAETSSRAGAESTTLSDAADRQQGLGRTGLESTSLSDAAARQAATVRVGVENTSLADAAVRQEVSGRSGTESTTLSDAGARSQNLFRTAPESTTLSDAIATQAVRVRGGAESITLSDQGVRVVLSARTGLETTVVSDGATRAQGLARAGLEALALSDTATRVSQSIRKGTEYLSGTPDYPVDFPTKAVAGVVSDEDTNAVIAGATVTLHRESDGVDVQVTTSAADGSYSFTRDRFDPYTYLVVVDWFDATAGVWKHGTSDPGQVPL